MYGEGGEAPGKESSEEAVRAIRERGRGCPASSLRFSVWSLAFREQRREKPSQAQQPQRVLPSGCPGAKAMLFGETRKKPSALVEVSLG